MDVEAVLAILALVAVLLLVLIASAHGAQLVGGIFQPPAPLGWPRGVQEDDDLHWSWAGGRPDEATDVRDLPSVERVAPILARYRSRSTRARS